MPIVVFASNLNPKNARILDKIGVEHRLLSYWYLKDLHPEYLKFYTQGLPTPRRESNGPRTQRVKLIDPD